MLRRPKTDLTILAAYISISFVYFGWRLLPHPGRLLLGGYNTRDPEFFLWSFNWWPHAIGHLMNPLDTRIIYAPTGVNIAWTATSPGFALVFSPLTLLWGPGVAYNVAALLMPALSAWTAYLLCRYLSGSTWGSLVGGYLFGFSSEMLMEVLWGNLDITGLFLIPLVALVVMQYLRADLSARGLIWRLGIMIAAQLLISTEHVFTLSVFLAIGFALAAWLLPEVRPRLRSALIPIVCGYLLGALLAAPFVVYVVIGIPSSRFGPTTFGSDLLSFVVPPPEAMLGGSTASSLTRRFVGAGAYLGLPTLLIIGAYARRARRPGVARLLIAIFLAACLAVLGSYLYVLGKNLVPLPWRLAAYLPGFEDVFPFRLAIFTALAASVIVALWTATTRGQIYARPFVLPVLAVAALVPAVWQSSYRTEALWHPQQPAFFTDSLYKTCIPRDETVAIFPFGAQGDTLLYQAEADFWFRVASDFLQPLPPPGHKAWASFDDDWIVGQLNGSNEPTMDTLLAFAALHHVDRFITLVSAGYPTADELRTIGPTQRVGGVLVSPGCGQPSLATRNLTTYVANYEHDRQSQTNIAYCLGPYLDTQVAGLLPSGALQGAKPANYVVGQGLTCARPPAGYTQHGLATAAQSVAPGIYPLYAP